MFGVKGWINKYVLGLVIERFAKPIAEFLNGKKTYTGIVSILVWALIYVVPQAYPDLAMLAAVGESLRSALENLGVHLDTELLVGGASLTVVGVLHKIKKYFSGEQDGQGDAGK